MQTPRRSALAEAVRVSENAAGTTPCKDRSTGRVVQCEFEQDRTRRHSQKSNFVARGLRRVPKARVASNEAANEQRRLK